jgi:hypothetical protein
MPIYVFKSNISSPTSTLTCNANLTGSIITPANEDGTTPVVLTAISTMNVERTSYINIFLSSLGINFQPNTTYSFVVSAGFLTDLGGGTNQQQTLLLQTPSVGSQYQSITVDNNSNITITFDKKIYTNTGSISIYSAGGTLIGTTNRVASTTGTSVTYKAAGLLSANTSYYITAPSGIVVDDFFLSNIAISSNTATITTSNEPQFHGLIANLQSNASIAIVALQYHGLVNIVVQSSMTIIPRKRHSTAVARLTSTSSVTAQNNNLSFQVIIPTNNYSCTFAIAGTNPAWTVNWGDSYFSTGTTIGGTTTFNHTYTTAGYYNIIVNGPGNSIQRVDWPVNSGLSQYDYGYGLVTKVYDWGIWNSNNFGVKLGCNAQLTNVPDYLPNSTQPDYGLYYSNTISLLGGCRSLNDPNVKQWFSRSGTIVKGTPTFVGTSKFGSYSLSGGTLTTDTMNFGTVSSNINRWSVEFWFYSNATTGYQDLITIGQYTSIISFNAGKINGYNVNYHAWNHIVFAVDGAHSTYYGLYINGTRVYYANSTPGYGITNLTITPGNVGYIDELRVSDINRYGIVSISSTLTVPTTTFTSDKNTMLLLHLDNTISDSSTYGVTTGADFYGLMYLCSSFNQDLSGWNVQNVLYHTDFDTGATSWTLPRPSFPS